MLFIVWLADLDFKLMHLVDEGGSEYTILDFLEIFSVLTLIDSRCGFNNI